MEISLSDSQIICKRRVSLQSAYETCRIETAKWAKTFYLGTLLLPPEKRKAIWAIYVWCRRTDELMDSPEAQKLTIRELSDRLDSWEEETRMIFKGHTKNGFDAAMVDTTSSGAEVPKPKTIAPITIEHSSVRRLINAPKVNACIKTSA